MQMDLRSSYPLTGSGPGEHLAGRDLRRSPSSLSQCGDRLCLNRSRLYGVPVDDRREH